MGSRRKYGMDCTVYIFRMRFGFEYSTTHIANALTHMAIPTVNGASKWTHPVIKRIIDNPRYLGESVYDGKSYGKLIPPIIDGELAEAKRRFEKKRSEEHTSELQSRGHLVCRLL